MVAATKPAPSISEPLTWAQICERHPDEWVSLVEIERENPNAVPIRSARVVQHAKTRAESLEGVSAWLEADQLVGNFFTGKVKRPLLFPRLVMTDEIRELLRSRR